MTQKRLVRLACVWLMLSMFVCFANNDDTRKSSEKEKSGIVCPKCGMVPASECRLEPCSACKENPGQIRHIEDCEALRHKCGSDVSQKPVEAQLIEKAPALPDDFAISYETKTAGVLPIVTSFMRIGKTKEGAFFFVQGHRAWDGEKQKETVTYTYELTNAQCLKIYESTQKLGFFNLKDHYTSDDLAGDESKMIKLTANGKSKTVSTYGMAQASFDKLVAIIEEHSLLGVLKSRK